MTAHALSRFVPCARATLSAAPVCGAKAAAPTFTYSTDDPPSRALGVVMACTFSVLWAAASTLARKLRDEKTMVGRGATPTPLPRASAAVS
eukprot:SAG11_NODE_2307_length_3546_cov_2.779809_2_plen_91_part_00